MTEIVKIVVDGKKLSKHKSLALQLYKEGMKYEGYVEHLNKKIEKETNFYEEKRVEKTYHYKDLSNEEIEYLKKNFRRIVSHFDKLSAKKYEDIQFLQKQKKNYIKKKNEIIEEWRIKYLSELDELVKNRHRDDKAYIKWAKIHNLVHQYNRVVPGVYSKESMREYVMSH